MADGAAVVWLFALGGTIAATGGTDGAPANIGLAAEDLIRAVPELGGVAELRAVSFRQGLSADLDLDDIVELAQEIDAAAAAGAAGVVVTQGTDTLEETAFVLDRLVTSAAAVVVTGAMRRPDEAGADGPANLLAAVRVAASAEADGLGTLVVFNDEIHAARFVRKTHSTSTATFRSPNAGPLGWLNGGRVRIPLVPRHRTPRVTLPSGHVTMPRVALARLGLGEDSSLLEWLGDAGYAGAVVEVYGAGNISHRTIGTIKALASSYPVVVASRTGAGELSAIPSPLISAAALDGLKARLLLSLLIAAGAERPAIKETFARTSD